MDARGGISSGPGGTPGPPARLVRAPSPAAFFDRCGPFLRASEAENNLLLGLAEALLSGNHDFDDPVYLAWVEDAAGEVVGVAFRTPPFKLGVSALPLDVVPALVEDVAGVYDAIPAVMGPERVAERVARAWAEPRGLAVRRGMALRIHALQRVNPDLPRAPGELRRARPDEHGLVRDWLDVGGREMGIPGLDPAVAARRMIDDGAAWLWDDHGPVSMAAALGATATAVRIGYVYTPRPLRGRGYATSTVAELTARMLAEGRRHAFLYTDRTNPTSNAIYARIGYVPVQDLADVEIVSPGGGLPTSASGGGPGLP